MLKKNNINTRKGSNITKVLLVIVVVVVIAGLQMLMSNNVVPKNMGVKNGLFSPLSKSPNGVSSQSTEENYYVEPLPMKDDFTSTKKALLKAVETYGNSKVITEENNYIHVVFTTSKMKFKDDLELYINELEKVVHYRSASRVGYSDMGLNRQRYNAIAELYEAIKIK
jgi:uncharacterized protein (DUF1499 family)